MVLPACAMYSRMHDPMPTSRKCGQWQGQVHPVVPMKIGQIMRPSLSCTAASQMLEEWYAQLRILLSCK